MEDFFGKILLGQPKSRDSRLAGDGGGYKLPRMSNPTEPQSSQPIIAMCRPTHFGVQYEINPWMEGNIGRVDAARAREQWDALHALLAEHARWALDQLG